MWQVHDGGSLCSGWLWGPDWEEGSEGGVGVLNYEGGGG
jgi:hypothetical protein